MVNLVRKHQKVFAGNAINNGQFGSLQATTKVLSNDPDVIQALPAFDEGWNDATLSSEELVPLEEMQSLHNLTTRQISYGLQKGIPEHSVELDYYIGDITREVGGSKIYESITDNNIGNALTDAVNWKIWDVTANKLNLTPQDQVIAGGVINYTSSHMRIDTEGAAASDTLDTISTVGVAIGDIAIIRQLNSARNITIGFLTGNITLSSSTNITFTDVNDSVTLMWTGVFWTEIARGSPAAKATTTNEGVVELLTNAEALAGTDSDRAMTIANLTAIYASRSTLGSGLYAVPTRTTTGGGYVQKFTFTRTQAVSAAPNGGTAAILFGASFPTAISSVVVSVRGVSGANSAITEPIIIGQTQNGFTIQNFDGDTAITSINYIAIGY